MAQLKSCPDNKAKHWALRLDSWQPIPSSGIQLQGEVMSKLHYQSGFGNELATEAVAGALPKGQNSPQKSSLGLYTEQFSGTPFTAPRATNRRAWLYRIRPSVTHRPFVELPQTDLRSGPFNEILAPPNQPPWDPLPHPPPPRG